MTYEQIIAAKTATEAAFLADPSPANLSAYNRANEAWQLAVYENGDAWWSN